MTTYKDIMPTLMVFYTILLGIITDDHPEGFDLLTEMYESLREELAKQGIHLNENVKLPFLFAKFIAEGFLSTEQDRPTLNSESDSEIVILDSSDISSDDNYTRLCELYKRIILTLASASASVPANIQTNENVEASLQLFIGNFVKDGQILSVELLNKDKCYGDLLTFWQALDEYATSPEVNLFV